MTPRAQFFTRGTRMPKDLPGTASNMITALVASRRLDMNRRVTVPKRARAKGSATAGLKAGERLTARDLMYGMLLRSGSDAARTLALSTSHTYRRFGMLIRQEDNQLHLQAGSLRGSYGWRMLSRARVTAHDLARIGHALLRVRLLRTVVGTRRFVYPAIKSVRVHDWTNLNRLPAIYRGATGVYLSILPHAKYTIVASATRSRQRLIAVIVGATHSRIFGDARALLNFGWHVLH